MKNILVPTDFTRSSLEVINQVIKKQHYRPVNIHIVHMVQTPTDISDLMFINKNSLYDQVPYHFFNSLDLLRNSFPSYIHALRFEFYYGSNLVILKSIIENLQIDEICVLHNYDYKLPMEDSVNMMPLIEHCQVPIHKIQIPGRLNINGKVTTSLSNFYAEENM